MKNQLLLLLLLLGSGFSMAQNIYQPSPANLEARRWFQDAKFGLFIHWGVYSILGNGEWVMNNRNIPVKDYEKLASAFNPSQFDAAEWVSLAKAAGMKYITLITRHHDGFSMWDTRYSDFDMMSTPYKKDIIKQLADECRKQGIKLCFYYSLLDWRRDDYAWKTGRTGQGTGRIVQGNWEDYINFMKNQLTELLTNYGEISGIWLDGHWDQTAPEGATDRSARIDWHYDQLYSLIHKLQPQCLIGNNHHLTPFSGEDFQMFEKDLPGENKSGLSYQEVSDKLPVETCETMNGSWGFNIYDTNYKSAKELVHYLVRAGGHNANFLLNVGPMSNGKIQPEFVKTLQEIGGWLHTYGETIYGTRGIPAAVRDWGVVTQKGNKWYVHILDWQDAVVAIPNFGKKIKTAQLFKDKSLVKILSETKEMTVLQLPKLDGNEWDTVVELTVE